MVIDPPAADVIQKRSLIRLRGCHWVIDPPARMSFKKGHSFASADVIRSLTKGHMNRVINL